MGMSLDLLAGARQARCMTWTEPVITIRAAASHDAAALTALAQLDSAAVPRGELLVAAVDGRVLAALSRETGGVIADPFRHTGHLVAMLRERAARLEHRPRSAAQRVRTAAAL